MRHEATHISSSEGKLQGGRKGRREEIEKESDKTNNKI